DFTDLAIANRDEIVVITRAGDGPFQVVIADSGLSPEAPGCGDPCGVHFLAAGAAERGAEDHADTRHREPPGLKTLWRGVHVSDYSLAKGSPRCRPASRMGVDGPAVARRTCSESIRVVPACQGENQLASPHRACVIRMGE